MESLSGPDLVKYIQKMNPGAGIEEVLEKNTGRDPSTNFRSNSED